MRQVTSEYEYFIHVDSDVWGSKSAFLEPNPVLWTLPRQVALQVYIDGVPEYPQPLNYEFYFKTKTSEGSDPSTWTERRSIKESADADGPVLVKECLGFALHCSPIAGRQAAYADFTLRASYQGSSVP